MLQLDALRLGQRDLERKLLVARQAEEQRPARPVQVLPDRALEIVPALEGSGQQVDVLGGVVEEPQGARAAMRGALAVTGPELLDADRVDAVERQLAERRR